MSTSSKEEKKEYAVWREKDEKTGTFEPVVAVRLSYDTASVIRKLLQVEYPDDYFSVSIGAPKAYRF